MEASIPSAVADVHQVRRGPFVVTRLHRSGVAPHRVLLIGSRAVLAPAGRERAEGFGSRVADRVWLRTRRGVDVDMVWELRPVLAAIRGGLESARLWRYDAVAIVFAVHPSGVQERWRLRGLQKLLRRVVEEVSSSTHVLLVTYGDASRSRHHGRHAGFAASGSGAELPKVSRLSTSTDARTSADAVAHGLLAPLAASDAAGAADPAHRQRSFPDAEEGRQRAVDDLALRGRRVERRLQDVVDSAQETFESASAEITIIDRDQQWTLAAAGRRRPDMPREVSLCNRSIGRAAPMVVGDVWNEPALMGDPLVAASDPIRFYASYPIESIDGYRIGVLCVWDDAPHPVEDFDVRALRDLALLAEAEIIGGAE